MEINSKPVFVYGTLRPDVNTKPWSEALFTNPSFNITKAKAVLMDHGLYYYAPGNFPTIKAEKGYKTEGYVLEENENFEKFIEHLDEIEEFPTLYDRKLVTVETEAGQVEALSYFMNPSYENDWTPIQTSCYKEFVESLTN